MQRLIWRLAEPCETLARPADPADVLGIRSDAELDDVRSVGVEPADAAAIWQTVVDLYKTGLHPAIGFCLRRRGKVIFDRTLGHIDGGSLAAGSAQSAQVATPDTLFNLCSASKAITAMVIHLLDDRGELHLDDVVAEYVPEFARHGKDRITVRHVTTDRAGLPTIPGGTLSTSIWSPIRRGSLNCSATPPPTSLLAAASPTTP